MNIFSDILAVTDSHPLGDIKARIVYLFKDLHMVDFTRDMNRADCMLNCLQPNKIPYLGKPIIVARYHFGDTELNNPHIARLHLQDGNIARYDTYRGLWVSVSMRYYFHEFFQTVAK